MSYSCRIFSRNSASSRAIPVEKQIVRLMDDPFFPVYWGKNQKGMQADVELDEAEQKLCRDNWIIARDNAIRSAKTLLEIGVHKQITNRLLEPFMWHTVVCTATEWSNFFNLRDHHMAQPEIQRIANMMRLTYEAGNPQPLKAGEWHLPFIQPWEFDELETDQLVKLSCARCARVSYLTHDGKRDIDADLTLYNRLLDAGHMSPFEHAARPAVLGDGSRIRNFQGWVQHRAEILGEEDRFQYMKDRGLNV